MGLRPATVKMMPRLAWKNGINVVPNRGTGVYKGLQVQALQKNHALGKRSLPLE
jgi:hypothetical protein